MNDWLETDWSMVDFEPKKADAAKVAPVIAPKGCCPKCGKHIGKGIYFHVKACKGD